MRVNHFASGLFLFISAFSVSFSQAAMPSEWLLKTDV